MPLALTITDVIVISPGAFVVGGVVGYIIRARYNGGKGEK